MTDLSLYAIYDRLAGVYGEPFVAQRDELAIRRFMYVMQSAPMVAQDCDLYKLGDYDTVSGVIYPCSQDNVIRPVFVLRYQEDK